MSNAVAVPQVVRTRPRISSGNADTRKKLDFLTWGSAVFGAAAMALILGLFAIVLVYGAFPAIRKFGVQFFYSTDWDPVMEQFGALPAIYGTMVSSLIAMIVAIPLSIGSAIYLVRLAPRWLVAPVSFLIELLAAIPSIAYGLWGIAVLVPFMQHTGQPFLKSVLGRIPLLGNLFSGPAYGFGMLSASLIIALMVIPIVTAVTRDVLKTVPRELEEGAYALGATWWQATKVVLIHCRMGIIGAIILGFARAIGETMAAVMIIGNVNKIEYSLLQPGQTMASLLANEFREADKEIYIQALIYIALTLLLLTIIFNGIARVLIMRMTAASKGIKPANPVHAPGAHDSAASAIPADSVSATASQSKRAAIRHDKPSVRLMSEIMKILCYVSAWMAVSALGLILGYVLFKGVASLDINFFTQLPGPLGTPTGMRNCIMGTVVLIGLGSLIGVPLGILTGVYLSEYSRDGYLSSSVRLIVDVLAGTPSIIVGVLAYTLVVRPMGHFSGWAGAAALGIMMCPIIARTTEEMLRLVPQSYREASLGMGGSQFHTLFKVIIPAASTGIITGIMLAVARIAGETAPLLFTALGNDSDVWDSSTGIVGLLSAPNKPFPSLTLKIYQYATSAETEWKSQAWAGMLVLITVILVLSAAVRYVSRDKHIQSS